MVLWLCMRHGGFSVLACGFAVCMCGSAVSFRCVVIALCQFCRCLKMVVGRCDVMRRRKVVVLARHVSFGVSHDDVFRWMNRYKKLQILSRPHAPQCRDSDETKATHS